MSLFLVSLISPNKQFSKGGTKLLRFESRNVYVHCFLLNVNLFCFIRQLPLSFTYIFSPAYPNVGARLLLFIVGDLMTSSDNPLDFLDEILLVLPIFSRYLFTV